MIRELDKGGKRPVCYVSGAIRGDVKYRERVLEIIEVVAERAQPRTQLDPRYTDLLSYMDTNIVPEVAERDRSWLDSARCMVAEISGPSTGTGWEICYATRIARIPCLCLHHADAEPSLMILQDKSRYLLTQKYTSSSQMKSLLRIFLRLALHFDDIREIRKRYHQEISGIDEEPPALPTIDTQLRSGALMDSSPQEIVLKQQQAVFDLAAISEKEYLMLMSDKPRLVDFKDKAELSVFLVRALLAQSKWTRLRTQRIGSTFVSGNKSELILSLTRFARYSSISRVYDQLEKIVHYSPKAFSKNIRAFRAIGILENTQRPRFGSTKFKTNAYIIKTLSGEYRILSSRPALKRLRNVIIPTGFFLDLAAFIAVFGTDPLLSFFRAAERGLREGPRGTDESPHVNDPPERIFATKWGLEAFEIASSRVEPIWESAFSTEFHSRR